MSKENVVKGKKYALYLSAVVRVPKIDLQGQRILSVY